MIRFTVAFDPPFWVGYLERELEPNSLSMAKVFFGAEPSDQEVHHLILNEFDHFRFVESAKLYSFPSLTLKNPKRRQREAQKELQDKKIVTKAQERLKAAEHQQKQSSNQLKAQLKKIAEDEKFQLRQLKKKHKKRGH